MSDEALTEDRLLGGRLRLMQPARGYRAATDPVLLAAATAARPGERVLDLGCGAGAAALCLAARVPGLALTGIEISPFYAGLARRNALANGAPLEVVEGDVAAPPAELRALTFDRAIMNPPFHAAVSMPSPLDHRDTANREGEAPLAAWVATALARLAPRGWLTVIQRTERLPELLTALEGKAGDIAVRPLAAREGHGARRVILAARKGARGPFRLCAPLILHAGPAHARDADDFAPEAAAILRDAAPLPL